MSQHRGNFSARPDGCRNRYGVCCHVLVHGRSAAVAVSWAGTRVGRLSCDLLHGTCLQFTRPAGSTLGHGIRARPRGSWNARLRRPVRARPVACLMARTHAVAAEATDGLAVAKTSPARTPRCQEVWNSNGLVRSNRSSPMEVVPGLVEVEVAVPYSSPPAGIRWDSSRSVSSRRKVFGDKQVGGLAPVRGDDRHRPGRVA
jgi:hypothetical protein